MLRTRSSECALTEGSDQEHVHKNIRQGSFSVVRVAGGVARPPVRARASAHKPGEVVLDK